MNLLAGYIVAVQCCFLITAAAALPSEAGSTAGSQVYRIGHDNKTDFECSSTCADQRIGFEGVVYSVAETVNVRSRRYAGGTFATLEVQTTTTPHEKLRDIIWAASREHSVFTIGLGAIIYEMDVENPSDMRLVAQTGSRGEIGSCVSLTQFWDFAYACCLGVVEGSVKGVIAVFDVTRSNEVQLNGLVNVIPTGDRCKSLQADTRRSILYTTTEKIRAYELANPKATALLREYSMQSFPETLRLAEPYLITSTRTGWSVYELQEEGRGALRLRSSYNANAFEVASGAKANVVGIAANLPLLYTTDWNRRVLEVYSLEDPRQPFRIQSVPLASNGKGLAVQAGLIFAAVNDAGMEVFAEAATPSPPVTPQPQGGAQDSNGSSSSSGGDAAGEGSSGAEATIPSPPHAPPGSYIDRRLRIAQISATGAALATSFGFSGTCSALRIVVAAQQCGTQRHPFSLHPTQAVLWGSAPLGMAAGNAAVAAATVLLFALGTHALRRLLPRDASTAEAAGMLCSPSIPLHVATLLQQGLAYAAFLLIFHGGTAPLTAAGAATLAACLALPLWSARAVRNGVPRHGTFRPNILHDGDTAPALHRLLYGVGGWSDTHTLTYTPEVAWVQRHASLIEGYTGRSVWFSVVEHAMSAAMAAAVAADSGTPAGCAASRAAAAGVFAVGAAAVAWIRPHAKLRDTVAEVAVSVLGALSMSLVASDPAPHNPNTSVALTTGCTALLLAAGVLLSKSFADAAAAVEHLRSPPRRCSSMTSGSRTTADEGEKLSHPLLSDEELMHVELSPSDLHLVE